MVGRHHLQSQRRRLCRPLARRTADAKLPHRRQARRAVEPRFRSAPRMGPAALRAARLMPNFKNLGAAFGSPLFVGAPRALPSLFESQRTIAMTVTTESKTDRIRSLNDAFRRTFVGGAVMITPGVEALALEARKSLLHKVR